MVKPTCTQSASTSASNSSCKYKGIRKRKWGKWVSEIRLPNSRERIWLGSYDSAEKAAKAFDAALYCLRGPDANFNFSENPPQIVGGRSLTPQEIQRVAARFANEAVEIKETGGIAGNIIDNINNVGTEQCCTNTTTSSSSLSVVLSDAHGDGGATTTQLVEESNELMDWSSYLSMLDTKQGIMSDYCFYSGLNHDLPPATAQLYSPTIASPSPPIDDDLNGGDSFSQSSYLWNF